MAEILQHDYVVSTDPIAKIRTLLQAAKFVEKNLWNPETKRLRRSYCRGPSDVEGFDSDYAFLIAGLLDLFAAAGNTKWLKWAYELQKSMDSLFWDAKLGESIQSLLLHVANWLSEASHMIQSHFVVQQDLQSTDIPPLHVKAASLLCISKQRPSLLMSSDGIPFGARAFLPTLDQSRHTFIML